MHSKHYPPNLVTHSSGRTVVIDVTAVDRTVATDAATPGRAVRVGRAAALGPCGVVAA